MYTACMESTALIKVDRKILELTAVLVTAATKGKVRGNREVVDWFLRHAALSVNDISDVERLEKCEGRGECQHV